MPLVITDDCTNCAACESECPVSAISEKNEKREIDQNICTECGACVEICPVDAIVEQ